MIGFSGKPRPVCIVNRPVISRQFRRLSTNPKVKELLKSVHICQSYRKDKSGTFLMAHGVVIPWFHPAMTHPPIMLPRLVHNCLFLAFLCPRMRFIAPQKRHTSSGCSFTADTILEEFPTLAHHPRRRSLHRRFIGTQSRRAT